MKTTLVLDDTVATRLKAEAVRRGTSMSSLVEAALRAMLDDAGASPELNDLPTWPGGPPVVDVADREALYDVMDHG